MTNLLVRWSINALALIITTLFVPGLHLAGPVTAFWAALVLGLVNTLIRPVLSFFSLPLQILTLGLFTLILNVLMLYITSALVPGFTIQNLSSAFFGVIVLSIISLILTRLLK